MHILHYLHRIDFADGGVVRAVLDMCTWMARAGARVTLATSDAKDAPATWKEGGPALPRVALVPPGRGFSALVSPSVARSFEPLVRDADVVHLHNIWDPVQIPLSKLARRLAKPYVQSPHGMLADWCMGQKRAKKSVYWKLFARELIDHAAFIVLTAQGELDQSAKRHPTTPGVVIPLVFDLDPYRAAPSPDLARANLPLPPADRTAILYLSRLDYKKRPDLLLAAGPLLQKTGLPFHLVFAGPSDPLYDAQLKAYSCELGLEQVTTFLGMVPAEWKPSLFSACDLFTLPTTMENFGFVYFESLVCGTPVVTTKGTDTWPELESSGAARIVNMISSDVPLGQVGGGDVRQLADAIARLIADRPNLKGMGAAGRRWVLEHMAPEVVVRRYFEMYERALNGRASGAMSC